MTINFSRLGSQYAYPKIEKFTLNSSSDYQVTQEEDFILFNYNIRVGAGSTDTRTASIPYNHLVGLTGANAIKILARVYTKGAGGYYAGGSGYISLKLSDGTTDIILFNFGAGNSGNNMAYPWAYQITNTQFQLNVIEKKIKVQDDTDVYNRVSSEYGSPGYEKTVIADNASYSSLNLNNTNLILTHTHSGGKGSGGYNGYGGPTWCRLSILSLNGAPWI